MEKAPISFEKQAYEEHINGLVKPTIVYIEESEERGNLPNSRKEALSYFLRNDCQSKVMEFENTWDLAEKYQEVDMLAQSGRLMAIIIKDEGYDKEDTYINQVIS